MRYVGNTVRDLQIAYIGGGSRGWAWGLMSDLALEEQMHGTIRLYDIDLEAAQHNEIIGNAVSAREEAIGKWNYVTVPSLKEALTGADFVIISILPGTFDEMDSDVHEPEKYGIYQSVGDTVGPGGLVRALRTIPMYVEFAEAIKEYCPNAWVINYTNPMTLCVRTLYEVYPEIKAFGCCHEVFGTQKLLGMMLEDLCDIKDVQRDEVDINVLGINHFTWLDKASYKGMDLMPLYKEFVDKYYETGFTGKSDSNWMNNSFESAQRVKFDLFKQYGLIAAAGDRHLAEFMPPWYLKNPDTVKGWMFGLTTVDYRKKELVERLERSARLVSGEEKLELKHSGEEGYLLMKSILGLGNRISNVNSPNRGQIPNLPLGVIVETNALFGRDKICPVVAGEIPGSVLSLVNRHVLNQENILKAAMTKDKELAFQAFMNDPLVTIDAKEGRKLFDTMLQRTKKYLPDWDI